MDSLVMAGVAAMQRAPARRFRAGVKLYGMCSIVADRAGRWHASSRFNPFATVARRFGFPGLGATRG